MSFLLDTNALSEGIKKLPNAGYMAWLQTASQEQLFTSCLVIGELYKGVELAADPAHHKRLEAFANATARSLAPRILPLDTATAKLWAMLIAQAQKTGKTPPILDSLIAAQAIQHQLTVITRNTADFRQFPGLKILCPWD